MPDAGRKTRVLVELRIDVAGARRVDGVGTAVDVDRLDAVLLEEPHLVDGEVTPEEGVLAGGELQVAGFDRADRRRHQVEAAAMTLPLRPFFWMKRPMIEVIASVPKMPLRSELA